MISHEALIAGLGLVSTFLHEVRSIFPAAPNELFRMKISNSFRGFQPMAVPCIFDLLVNNYIGVRSIILNALSALVLVPPKLALLTKVARKAGQPEQNLLSFPTLIHVGRHSQLQHVKPRKDHLFPGLRSSGCSLTRQLSLPFRLALSPFGPYDKIQREAPSLSVLNMPTTLGGRPGHPVPLFPRI